MLRLAGEFVRGWTGVQRLFAFIVLVVSCFVLIVAFSGDRWTQLLVTCICVLLLWLGASVAMPAEISRDRLRRYSLYVALTISLAVLFSGGQWAGWAIEFARRALPEDLAAYTPMLHPFRLGLCSGSLGPASSC